MREEGVFMTLIVFNVTWKSASSCGWVYFDCM